MIRGSSGVRGLVHVRLLVCFELLLVPEEGVLGFLIIFPLFGTEEERGLVALESCLQSNIKNGVRLSQCLLAFFTALLKHFTLLHITLTLLPVHYTFQESKALTIFISSYILST